MRTILPLLLAVTATPAMAAEPESYKDRLPRISPKSPADALGTFSVHEGFRIEQVAAEPLVYDPVAVSFDEQGRLFVVEMRGYSEDADKNLGRVRMLTDTDADGRFDRASVYVEGLSWPTAVLCYDGGVFVGAAPDILYCKDTDGDGRADLRKVVFTGFGRSNVQGLFNSFRWGLDNRIHGATSSSGGNVRRVSDGEKGEAVSVRGRDFSFDPRTLDFRAESGGAQHGMCFDDWGRKFATSNSDHIQMVMYEDRYIARNPFLVAPSPRKSIAADGPAATVYRSSPVEPWRIVRTELRVSGKVRGIVEGGGKPAGYFTGATGVTCYRGNAWPAEMKGQAFIGDVGSNLVHRKTLEPRGIEFRAQRADRQTEFARASDIWFRPLQFANAPDGTLYVLDMYREVIEHPKSLPPMIKKHLDLTSGRDRGRLYRIVPDDFQQPALPKLHAASTAQLVATLEHPNGWHRDTAARLLYERQDEQTPALVREFLKRTESPLGRMHGLYVLAGLKALTANDLMPRLADEHPRVREHAIRLAERVAADSPRLRERLYQLSEDDDLRVRYQLAFSLGEISGERATRALAKLARSDAADRWMRLAILSSAADRKGRLLTELATDQNWRTSNHAKILLSALAQQIGRAAQEDEVAGVLKVINEFGKADASLSQELMKSLSRGLADSGSPLRKQIASLQGGQSSKVLEQLLDDARQTAANAKASLEDRVEAIRSLGLLTFEEAKPLLVPLLDGRQPQAVQQAAVSTLSGFREPQVAELLLAHWSSFSPRLRNAAADALFARPERQKSLLQAVAQKRVRVTDLDPARMQLLAASPDEAIRKEAKRLFADANAGRRADVVKAYRDVLKLSGRAENGRQKFRKVCAACHKLEGVGHEIGYNLATLQNRGAETILLNLLDPNREVNPQYVNYLVVTADGRQLTGMIASETATSITLKRAENATDTVLRQDIDELQSTGLSIMPEGLEKQLSKQDMADLIAYLLSVK